MVQIAKTTAKPATPGKRIRHPPITNPYKEGSEQMRLGAAVTLYKRNMEAQPKDVPLKEKRATSIRMT